MKRKRYEERMRKYLTDEKKRNRTKRQKIVLGTVIFLWVCVCVILVSAWLMFGTQIKAAGSVQKLTDGLYTMEYNGDYGFDDFLEQGGADTDAEMADYIARFLSHGFWKTERDTTNVEFGCSTLSVTGTEEEALFGRNYDWKSCNAMIVHTRPLNGYESVSTCCLEFLGFGEEWKPEGIKNQYMALAAIYVPLDGMNEKGLCVADLINGDSEETHQDTDNADLTITAAIRLLLDKAATVDEAVALLGQYDMNSSIGTSHHLAISDSTGKSVVVEYINNEMVVTETSVVTNHYLSAGEKFGVGNEESHQRFNNLTGIRNGNEGILTKEELRDSMRNVSYGGITQWSIIYDKTNLTVDYYWQRQYNSPYHFVID